MAGAFERRIGGSLFGCCRGLLSCSRFHLRNH
jgi:hypothetical protein